jgi:hypothetical protein
MGQAGRGLHLAAEPCASLAITTECISMYNARLLQLQVVVVVFVLLEEIVTVLVSVM